MTSAKMRTLEKIGKLGAAIIMAISIGTQAKAGDPNFNFPAMMQHAFGVHFWKLEPVERARVAADRLKFGKEQDHLSDGIAVFVKSSTDRKWRWLTCTDVGLASFDELLESRNRRWENGDNWYGDPFVARTHYRDAFVFGITYFQTSVAILSSDFDIDKIIDKKSRFINEATQHILKRILGRGYEFLLEKQMRGITIDVVSQIQCENGIQIFHVRGD